MVKISDAIRKLVILKKSEGASYRMIAKDLNIGHSTVQYISTINSCERKPPRTYIKAEGQANAQFGRKAYVSQLKDEPLSYCS